MFVSRALVCAGLVALAALSLAHHGRRFLVVTEFRMPHPGDAYLIFDAGAMKSGSSWSHEASPGLLIGVGDQGTSALEVHGHFEKDGAEHWRHEATGIEFRHRLNDSPGWNFAAGIEAEVPTGSGPTAWSGQLIGGIETPKYVVAANLVAENDDGLDGRTTWSYRAGWSPDVPGRYGYSLEVAGGLESHASHELVFGIATSLGRSQVREYSSLLKLGFGMGLTRESPDWTVRAGVVLKL